LGQKPVRVNRYRLDAAGDLGDLYQRLTPFQFAIGAYFIIGSATNFAGAGNVKLFKFSVAVVCMCSEN
jgi:hypothetical protein